MTKILEKIVEPSRVETGSIFLLKIKVDRVKSHNLITEANENFILENGENLITEGDYYEESKWINRNKWN